MVPNEIELNQMEIHLKLIHRLNVRPTLYSVSEKIQYHKESTSIVNSPSFEVTHHINLQGKKLELYLSSKLCISCTKQYAMVKMAGC